MKRISILLILGIVLNTYAQDTKKALFLGNSYTYGNNLPQLIQNLAIANGDVFIKDQNTPGGYQLVQHVTNTTTLNKIAADDWDYVILQEQSQKPSFPPSQVATDVKPYAVILNDSIKANNSCTETLFFMTWGRKNGDQGNCANYAPLCTYEGMQDRLRESYLEMTVENNADCAPVGVAWKKMRQDFPTINLYTADESHPNINGSYLAACVFYTSMYHKSTVGNTYWASLDSLTAYRIQDIASSTVLDSLIAWSIEPIATSFEVNDTTIEFCDSVEVLGSWYFSNLSFSDTINSVGSCAEITNYTLQFGAQTIDSFITFCDSVEILGNWLYTDTNFVDTITGIPCNLFVNYEITSFQKPEITDYWDNYTYTTFNSTFDISFSITNADSVYIYLDSNLFSSSYSPNFIDTFSIYNECNSDELGYTVTVLSKSNCGYDSLTLYANCVTIDGLSKINETNFQTSPNPANNFIEIKSEFQEDFSVNLIDISGKVLISNQKSDQQYLRLDVSAFDKGIYFLIVYDKSGLAVGQKKLIIQ